MFSNGNNMIKLKIICFLCHAFWLNLILFILSWSWDVLFRSTEKKNFHLLYGVVHRSNVSLGEVKASQGYSVRPCLKRNKQITFIPTNSAYRGMKLSCLSSWSALSHSHTLNSPSASPVETISWYQATFVKNSAQKPGSMFGGLFQALNSSWSPSRIRKTTKSRENILFDPSTWMA